MYYRQIDNSSIVTAVQYTGDNAEEIIDFVENNDGGIEEEIVTKNCMPKTVIYYLTDWLDNKTTIYYGDYIVLDESENFCVIDEQRFEEMYVEVPGEENDFS